MAMRRLKAIKHGPPTCDCAISYGLWSDDPADPSRSVRKPEHIVKRCPGHAGVVRPAILDAMFDRETALYLDTITRVTFSGAKLTVHGFDQKRRLVITVAGATQSLRDDLARFELLIRYED